MKKNFIKKIYILSFLFFLSFILVKDVFASTFSLVPSKNVVGKEEQFYVDLILDTDGVSLNGLEGKINFNKGEISLVRVEDGKSMVGYWIEKPQLESGNNIKFSGIIPNGFDGVIDPFNPKHKLPGLIARFVFKSLESGTSVITAPPIVTTLNDGEGTTLNVPVSGASVLIQNVETPFIYSNPNDVNPELEFEIVKDPNLFDNKYVLIFKAKDKETGIEKVIIKEGRRDWKEIESPYLLEDQGRHSPISLMALNYSGTSIIKTIDYIPYKIWTTLNISLLIVFILLLFVIIKKIYVKYKK